MAVKYYAIGFLYIERAEITEYFAPLEMTFVLSLAGLASPHISQGDGSTAAAPHVWWLRRPCDVFRLEC